jgi:YggT family protein
MLCLIHYLLIVYLILLFARVLSSWIRVPPYGPARRIMDFVYGATEPVLRPLRGVLPPIRAGAVAFDLSPMIAFIVLGILTGAIHC